MPKVHFKSPLDDVTVEVPTGTTLLDAAEKCGAQVGHSCGGVCACSTCHVWVRKGLETLSEQTDQEMDRLDMGFDVRPGVTVKPEGFDVAIGMRDADDADRIFAALAEGGEVTMPIAETFSARRFGMVTDRYGIPWMVNCE